MIRKLAFVALAAMVVTAPAAAQDGTPAARAAVAMQNIVGSKYEGDLVVAKVAAEGNTLVITMDGQAGWAGFERDKAVDPFLQGFCGSDGGRQFLTAAALRVDTLDHGRDLRRGPTVTSCPAK